MNDLLRREALCALSPHKNRFTWALGLLVLSTLIPLTGCSNGVILVGQPEVFTRERLIDARVEDHSWLRSKLDNADQAFGYQGFIDRRILDVTIAKVQGEYGFDLPEIASPTAVTDDAPAEADPAAPPAEGGEQAETDQQADDASGDTNDDSSSSDTTGRTPLLGTNDTTPLLRADSSRIPTTHSDPTAAAKTKAQITHIEQLNDQLAYRSAVRAAMRQTLLDDSHDVTGSTLFDLKFDVVLQPSKEARQNALVVFTIQEPDENCSKSRDPEKPKRYLQWHEYEKWVESVESEVNAQAASLQRRLLSGRVSASDDYWISRIAHQTLEDTKKQTDALATIYSSIPPDGTPAKLAFTDLPSESQPLLAPLFLEKSTAASTANKFTEEEVMKKLEDRSDQIQNVLIGSLSLNDIRLPEREIVTQYLARNAVLAVSKFYEDRLRFVAVDEKIGGTPLIRRTSDAATGQNGLQYVELGPGIDMTALDTLKELEQKRIELLNKMDHILSGIECKHGTEPRVVDTIPKEYAQNISDVGAGRHLINFLAAFSGNLSSQFNLGASYERFVDEQVLLQAVQRRPLAIGFNDNSHGEHFGYILGPSFKIQYDDLFNRVRPDFIHRPIRHTVGATLVVPIWQAKLKLTYDTFWVTDEGKLTKPKIGSDGGPKGAGEMTLTLPIDYRALTRAVMYGADRAAVRPALDDINWRPRLLNDESKQPKRKFYELQAGCKTDCGNTQGELLILGHELWRNPQVFVGSQRADRVSVLADLDGLHAEFDSVRFPSADKSKAVEVDLTVLTSYGSATLRDAVRIHPPEEKKAAPKPALRLAGDVVVQDPGAAPHPKARFVFLAKPPLPDGFHALTLEARPAGQLSKYVEIAEVASLSLGNTGEVAFDVKVAGKKLGNTSGRELTVDGGVGLLEVRPMLQLRKDQDAKPILAGEANKVLYLDDKEKRQLTYKPASASAIVIQAPKSGNDPDYGKSEFQAADTGLKLQVPIPPAFFDKVTPNVLKKDANGDYVVSDGIELHLTKDANSVKLKVEGVKLDSNRVISSAQLDDKAAQEIAKVLGGFGKKVTYELKLHVPGSEPMPITSGKQEFELKVKP
ncbi:MAG: hypothetical protein AAF333_03660 [Planctomycetota bacterium]